MANKSLLVELASEERKMIMRRGLVLDLQFCDDFATQGFRVTFTNLWLRNCTSFQALKDTRRNIEFEKGLLKFKKYVKSTHV